MNNLPPTTYHLPPIRVRRHGFSIIELIVVLSFIAIFSVIALTDLLSRRNRVTLDNTTKQVVSLLREAQSRAMAEEQNTIWGVHFDNSGNVPFYALFKTSYSAANTVSGNYRLPAQVSYSSSSVAQGGTLDITFSQIAGIPSTSTTIGLRLTSGAAATSPFISRSASGKIFFDDFNRTNL